MKSTGEKSQSKDTQPAGAPAISLPKGGGAIRSIGEKFAANPVTGTGSLSVPIATSPGRSGFGPDLSLTYDSGAGNGPFGFGWNLSLPSITRKTDKGLPQYCDAQESDVFILSRADDLVPVLVTGGKQFEDIATVPGYTIHRYRPRVEGLFARIERWTRSDGDVHWRSISRDNLLTLYGKDGNSRIADADDPQRIFTWLICETRDDKGNALLYEYKSEDGAGVNLTHAHERNRGDRDDPHRKTNRYLKRIRYGNRLPLLNDAGRRPRFLTDDDVQNAGWMFDVVFDYGEHDTDAPKPGDAGEWIFRSDPFSTYRAGFEVRTTRLCRRILMFHHFPDEEDVGSDCLVRSTNFTYSHEPAPNKVRNPVYTLLHAITQTGYKREGDGYLKRSLPPIKFEYTQPVVQDVVEEVDPTSLENLPGGADGTVYQWTDLHGEGIPGVLTEQANAWFYKRNVSPASDRPVEFAPLERVAVKPNFALTGSAQFMDLAGDGLPGLVMLNGPTPGDAGWSMRYVRLMGEQKPHLLTKTVNNLGAETLVRYAPSTKFYLRDRRSGKPWITRLPFPVHVVERIETYDRISRNHFITRYAYHHGYFDGEEREFRGFGMVEQWDTEEMAALTGEGALPAATNYDLASSVPPTHTKTWFHTGAYLDQQHVSREEIGRTGLNQSRPIWTSSTSRANSRTSITTSGSERTGVPSSTASRYNAACHSYARRRTRGRPRPQGHDVAPRDLCRRCPARLIRGRDPESHDALLRRRTELHDSPRAAARRQPSRRLLRPPTRSDHLSL